MGSTGQEDRSLGGGISIPQWMKGKLDHRFDFGENALSPPSHGDSFFYIRYPKTQNQQTSETQAQGYRPINEVLSGNSISSSTSDAKPNQQSIEPRDNREIDFSKHPPSCQPFIPSAANKGNESRPPKVVVAGNVKPKSQGTDDGFHGEPALCGKSIVHVANQIMSTKFNRMFTSEQQSEHPKKGSKSLPATPLASPMGSPDSSPKARRRIVANRYFTGPFVPDKEKYQGSWILASILGQSREIVTSKIDEEDERSLDLVPPRSLNRKKSISSQNLTYIGDSEKPPEKQKGYTNVLQAKPSELREMNFLSPTSM